MDVNLKLHGQPHSVSTIDAVGVLVYVAANHRRTRVSVCGDGGGGTGS